jgi:hypothetical protein
LVYPEFDKKILIKANDDTKVRSLFSDPSVREVFQSLEDFTFAIIMHHFESKGKSPCLELYINSAIKDAVWLRKIYSAFVKVLTLVDSD